MIKILNRGIYIHNTVYANKTSSFSVSVIPLELALEQIGNHLTSSDARGSPQGREVKGAREGIGVSEEKHGRDPAAGILEGEARGLHLILLDLTAAKVVNATGRVDLGLVGTGDVGKLGALEDVEVIVCGVASGVSFSADGSAWISVSSRIHLLFSCNFGTEEDGSMGSVDRTEDDQIFGDTCSALACFYAWSI